MVRQTQRPWVRQKKNCFHQIRVTLRNIYKKQHGARPCVEKILLIFFVPPNEELQGTLHPQKLGCTPKNEGKGYMYPQMKKPVGMLIHLMYGNNYSSPLSYKVTPSVPLL